MKNNIINPIPLSSGGFLRFAHHPHCDRHNHHLIWIMGHPFCLGCTCMYSGMILGILISFIIEWQFFSLLQWIILHIALIIPTILQVKIQVKSFKIASRTLLGIATSSYFMSGIFFLPILIDRYIFVIVITVIFAMSYRTIKSFRNRFTKSPCDDCPLGRFPICEWNLPHIMNEMPDGELITALQTQNITDLLSN